ncbi:MAG: transcription elongation factor GreA [Chloroflexi bacterium]|nr:transcription elongation factor GreA [Chloroflexota bacterium]
MPTPSAAALFRDVGLLADGPLPLGRPVPARGPGVFIVELASPLARVPIELTRVGKWLEHVPTLQVDGQPPTSRTLAARLASFWLPAQTVLYVGATAHSIGGRLSAMDRTALGDRRPSSAGHWLHALRLPGTTRVWWAATDAPVEYEDALLAAFAEGVTPAEREALPDATVILPFANLRRPTGERRPTGIEGSLLAEVVVPPPPPKHVVVIADGDAEGARGEPPERRRAGPAGPSGKAGGGGPRPRVEAPPSVRETGPAKGGSARDRSAATMTAEGVTRLQSELDGLIGTQRPQVIARIRAAKELGDLKENADYTSAREEQSFLEGRIQAIEAQLRTAVIADAPPPGSRADLGSVLTVEVDGETDTYTLVGSAEADAAAGRLSVASPVGRALLKSQVGDEVSVMTPRGPVTYRVTKLV